MEEKLFLKVVEHSLAYDFFIPFIPPKTPKIIIIIILFLGISKLQVYVTEPLSDQSFKRSFKKDTCLNFG